LTRSDGTFWPLGPFLRRVGLGRIRRAEVRAEWAAQYRRFVELTCRMPVLVNSHQHVSLFPPCEQALVDVLQEAGVRPYLRRVVEPVRTLARVPGARLKRMVLASLGRRAARRAARRGFPGCDWLVGITDPAYTGDQRFWGRWLSQVGHTGTVELCCHPGYQDPSLVGRDCEAGDGLARRPREINLLRAPSFQAALTEAGFRPGRPSELADRLCEVADLPVGNGRGRSDRVRRAAELERRGWNSTLGFGERSEKPADLH
jgi:chitin disaccharide deacetylase